MPSRLSIITFAFLLMNLFGCATGPGFNRHAYFSEEPSLLLPFAIKVDDQSKVTEVAAKMGEGSEFQSFIIGGLPALAMIKMPGAIGGIRGKFAVGAAFERYVKSLANPDPNKQEGILNLRLVYFQQYLMPGISPRLKALLKFEAVLVDSNEVAVSAYSFDWVGQGLALTPGEEKDMLNEMICQSLKHWAKIFLDVTLNNSHLGNFPTRQKGTFSGNGVKCTYDIFATP